MRTIQNQRRTCAGDLRVSQSTLAGARTRGFSLVELLVVVAIALIVSALAIPSMTRTMDAYRTRGAMTSVAGLVQRCRLQSIRHNTSERVFVGVNQNGVVFLYCKDLSNQGAAVLPGDPQITLEAQFSQAPAPTGGGATALTAQNMWGANFAQVGVNSDIYFNSRGLPCSAPAAGAACTTISGYVSYFNYKSGNTTRVAAISVSPAARVQTWFWNGSGWGN